MIPTLVPVDKTDTEFLIIPPRPQFENVQDKIGVGEIVIQLFLLDLFPDAAAAYSLRLLRTAYTGPAIRVKRTSDNAVQDIGFSSDGGLDVAALTTFVGLSDGLITIWYDQSGNGINLDAQTNDAELPKIVIAGVLQSSNSHESANFDGIDDVLQSTLSLNSPVDQLSIFCVWQKKELTNAPTNFNFNAPSLPARVSTHAPLNTGVIFWDAGNASTDRLQTTGGFNDTVQHVLTFIKSVSASRQEIKRDGLSLAQRLESMSITTLSKIAIGSFGIDTSFFADMQFQELVFYDRDVLNDVVSIENNLLAYWPVLGNLVTESGDTLVTDLGDNLVHV